MISIIIPTYNEHENIVNLVNRIIKNLIKTEHKFEIIIVDDNSPDNTAREIKEKFKDNRHIRLFVRKNSRELASAILYGIKKSKGNVIVGMDADFDHPPEAIEKLISGLKNNDLIVASRFVKGGGMEDKSRYFFSYIFNLLLKYIFGFPIMDNLSGFYSIKRESLFGLPISKIYRGYGDYHLRLVYLAKKYGFKIKEIPVFFPKRKYGQSKTNLLKVFFAYLWSALNLKTNKYL